MNTQIDSQSTLLEVVNTVVQALEESRKQQLHAVINSQKKLTETLALPLAADDIPGVTQELGDLLPTVHELDEKASAFRERVAHAYQRAARLARPTLPPTTKQRVEAIASGLRQLGWNALEREGLEADLGPDEDILHFDRWEVVTNQRVIDRAVLRDRSRPISWTRIDRWLAQFPPIPARSDRAQ